MKGWLFLVIAIVGEVIATSALKSSEGFTKLAGTVAKLAMRQPFVLFKGLTFQKLCLPGAFRPGDHHNKMLRP
ncbi:SMR family transporter, partial [Escherichia coli]